MDVDGIKYAVVEGRCHPKGKREDPSQRRLKELRRTVTVEVRHATGAINDGYARVAVHRYCAAVLTAVSCYDGSPGEPYS